MTKPPSAATPSNVGSDEPPLPAAALEWEKTIPKLGISGMVKQLASNCHWVKREGDTIWFAVDASHRHFLNDSRHLEFQQALQKLLGNDIAIRIDIATVELPHTPARLTQQLRENRFKQATHAIETDPGLQTLIKLFNANITPGSIEPLDEESK